MKYKLNNLIKELPKNAIQKKIGVGVWCFLLLVYVSCRTASAPRISNRYLYHNRCTLWVVLPACPQCKLIFGS